MIKYKMIFIGVAVTFLSANCLAQGGYTVAPSFSTPSNKPLFGSSNPADSDNNSNSNNNNGNLWGSSQSNGAGGAGKDQTPYFAQNQVGGTGQVSTPPLTADSIQNCSSGASASSGASSGASCAISNVIKYYNSLLWRNSSSSHQ